MDQPVNNTLTNVYEFGDALLSTRDLDPVYCSLFEAQLPEPQLCRLLLSLPLVLSSGPRGLVQ